MHVVSAVTWDFLWWPQSGQWYAFWSSFGACLTYFAVIGVAYRHLKCKSCWRIAHHRVEGTHYKTCHKHATPEEHQRLYDLHAQKFPEQHKLFAKEHAALSKGHAESPAPVPDGPSPESVPSA
jgi:hypothetical protein